MKTLKIISNKKLPFLEYISRGEKTAEGRIATKFVKNLEIGELLQLKNETSSVICNIRYLNFYRSFREMLTHEKFENMVPFVDSIEDAIKIYESFPGANRINSLGCCAIGISPMTDDEIARAVETRPNS